MKWKLYPHRLLFALGAGALVWAVRRGGVRCPNCGRRWYGGVPIAARTHEGRFRCPNCGTMIPL